MGTINGTSRVAEAMSQGLWTAAPDMTLRQASALMAAEYLDMLTVEDDDGHAIGIIAWRTALESVARGMGELPVTAVMEPLREVCHPGDMLDHARTLMAALDTYDLPVCDFEGHPLGIISFGGAGGDRGRYNPVLPTSFRPSGRGLGGDRAPTVH